MATITIKDLADIHDAEMSEAALASAKELIAQGWTADPSTYDIGSFPGDLEAAEAVSGVKLIRSEVVEHEARIRGHLARLLA